MKNLGRLAVLISLGAGLALSAVGCGADKRYEDCEVSDQYVNGDVKASPLYEPDCGYWTRGGSHFLHNGFLGDATWTYWSWVVIGQNSYAPGGWKPPHGLKPPVESKDATKRRKANDKRVKQEQERTKKSNGTSGGNQQMPKDRTVPKPAAPRPATRPH